MKNAITIALASALITTGFIKAAPAFAEAPAAASQANVAQVRTADLDLGSSEGQRQLDQRLARAARDVCGAASDVDVKGKNDVRKCREVTLAKAREQRDILVVETRGTAIAVTASR